MKDINSNIFTSSHPLFLRVQRQIDERKADSERKTAALAQKQKDKAAIASVSAKIGLDSTRRPDNLRLLRSFLGEQQGDFVRMLGIGSQSFYSMVENRKAMLDDSQARSIESNLSLPLGWLDRDNSLGLLYLSNENYLLIKLLKGLAPAVTASLVEMLTNTHHGNFGNV
jgi:hypothetical protein